MIHVAKERALVDEGKEHHLLNDIVEIEFAPTSGVRPPVVE